MTTTLYLRSGETASSHQSPAVGSLPSGFLAAWDFTASGFNGASACFLDSSAGSAQVAATGGTWSAQVGGTKKYGIIQYASNPLAGSQTISAGNWTIGYAGSLSNGGASLKTQGYIALYLVNGATGASRTVIFALAILTGTGTHANASEATFYSTTASGSSATVTAGDYLVLEVGEALVATGTQTPGTFSIYDSGTVAISSDNAAASNAQSFITAPVTLTFQPAASGTPQNAVVAQPSETPQIDLLMLGAATDSGMSGANPPVPTVPPGVPRVIVASESPRMELLMQGTAAGLLAGVVPVPFVKPPPPALAFGETPRFELLMPGAVIPDTFSMSRPESPGETVLYLRSGEPAIHYANPGIKTLPAAFLGSWSQTNAALGGSACAFLDPLPGAAQNDVAPTWAAIGGGTQRLGHVQYASSPLAGNQTINPGQWLLTFAGDVTNASASEVWAGMAALYLVNGSTGAIRTVIFGLTTIGSAGRLNTTETTCLASVLGAGATVTAGDYLVLEMGLRITALSQHTPTTDVYDNGVTPIIADGVAASSAQSALIAPQTLLFQTPAVTPTRTIIVQASESPRAELLMTGAVLGFSGRVPVGFTRPPLPVYAAGETPAAVLLSPGAQIPDVFALSASVSPPPPPFAAPPPGRMATASESPRIELLVQGSSFREIPPATITPTVSVVPPRPVYVAQSDPPVRELLATGAVIDSGFPFSGANPPTPAAQPAFWQCMIDARETPAVQFLVPGGDVAESGVIPVPTISPGIPPGAPELIVSTAELAPLLQQGQALTPRTIVQVPFGPPITVAVQREITALQLLIGGSAQAARQVVVAPIAGGPQVPRIVVAATTDFPQPILTQQPIDAPTSSTWPFAGNVLPTRAVIAARDELASQHSLLVSPAIAAVGLGLEPLVPTSFVVTTEGVHPAVQQPGRVIATSGVVPVPTVRPAQTSVRAAPLENPAFQLLVGGSVHSVIKTFAFPYTRGVVSAMQENPAGQLLVQGSTVTFVGVVPTAVITPTIPPGAPARIIAPSETPALGQLLAGAATVFRSSAPALPRVLSATVAGAADVPAWQTLVIGSARASAALPPAASPPLRATVAQAEPLASQFLVTGSALARSGVVAVPIVPPTRTVTVVASELIHPGQLAPGRTVNTVGLQLPAIPARPVTASTEPLPFILQGTGTALRFVGPVPVTVITPTIPPGAPARIVASLDVQHIVSAGSGVTVSVSRTPMASPPPRPVIVMIEAMPEQVLVPGAVTQPLWRSGGVVTTLIVTIASPLLLITDNGDGTATARVVGSSVGSTNDVLTQPADGNLLAPAFTNQGQLAGDGSVTFPLASGVYWAYCYSILDPQSATSQPIYVSVGSATLGTHEQCVQGVLARLAQLTFADTPTAPGTVKAVIDGLVPIDDTALQFPCLLVTIEGETEQVGMGYGAGGGSNYRDDYGYPVKVTICDQMDMVSLADQQARRVKYTKWREQIARAFSRQKLATTGNQVFDCIAAPLGIVDGRMPLQQYVVSGLTLRFYARLTRGVTS